ncbi:MAG: T9SS type A sorting domain-containing protein [Ignavibacteriae bacterium]|nr:T9SS type A sorting domain-containing protein [Ignavibacteriota bacterium]
MKATTLILILILCALLTADTLQAQLIRQSKAMIGASSGFSKSSQFQMNVSVGQPISGTSASSQFRQGVGFWNGDGGGGQPPIPLMFYNDGWNMVSVPFVVPNYSKSFIFPTSSSSAFSYQGGYQQQDTLKHGVGYWLKFPGNQALPLQGGPRNSDTLELADNWNMIGATSIPVDTANIIQVPENLISTNYFGYNSGYFATNIIEPGKAYWVKAKGVGSIILKDVAPPPNSFTSQQLPAHREEMVEEALNTISFTVNDDASSSRGKQQVLQFGFETGEKMNLEKFELPPVPPVGAFDIRFASNRLVEILPSRIQEPVELPVRFQTNNLPITVTMSLKHQDEVKYSLVEREGKKMVAFHKLEQNRSLTISINEDKKYFLRVESVPKEFFLHQNYPNPFNPVTTIRFDLPSPATVTLQMFNILGQEVATELHKREMEEGQHAIDFDASLLPTGLYFYRINVLSISNGKHFQDTKTMMLVK